MLNAKEQFYALKLRELIRNKKETLDFNDEILTENTGSISPNNFGAKLINQAKPIKFDGASKKKTRIIKKTIELNKYIKLARKASHTAAKISTAKSKGQDKKGLNQDYSRTRAEMGDLQKQLSPEQQQEAPSMPLKDPVQENLRTPKPAEKEPSKISPKQQHDKALNFRKLKDKAKKKQNLAERAKKAKQRIQKAAKIAKQLRRAKNIKQVWTIFKVGTGITIKGLILTYLAMVLQFILGNIFEVKYFPKLGRYEKIIFLVVSIIVVPISAVSLFLIMGPSIAVSYAIFEVFKD